MRLEDEKYNGDKIYINASGTKSISSDFASVKAYAEDWEYVYRTVTVENDTSSRISLANYSDADLNFYLDDVSVCEIDITGFEPTSIELFASNAGVVPRNGINTVNIRSNVYNQLGGQEGVRQTMDSYSIVGSPVGISISNNGVLTIDSRAEAGTVTVEGMIETTNGEISQTIDIEVLPMIESEDSNLFANGSFEDADDLLFEGDFKVLSDEFYDGNYAAFVDGDISQNVYLKPDKTYIVMAFVKGNDEFSITAENGAVSGVSTREDGEWKRIWATIDTAGIQDNLLTNITISSQSEYYADNLFVGELTEGFEDCEFSVSYIESDREITHLVNGDVFPKIVLKNGSEAKSLRLICGLYNKNNPTKLIDTVYIDNTELGSFEEREIEFETSIEITDYKNQILKFFAWDSELSPLGEADLTGAKDEVIYYVSPDGIHSDSLIRNPASVKFKSIGSVHTQLLLRETNNIPYPKDGITIILEEGIYPYQTTFSTIHGGTEDAPVVIKAADGADVTITGDKVIEGPFVEADTNISEKLIDQEAKKHLVQINLVEQGITGYDGIYTPGYYNVPWSITEKEAPPMELVIDGKIMTLARYPNTGYMNAGTIVDEGTVFGKNLNPEADESILTQEQKNGGFVISPDDDRYKKWGNAPQARIYGFFRYPWADQTIEIESIDSQNETLKVKHPSYYEIEDNAYFYAFDILEEIDTPGEYYIDRSNGMLYLYPPEDVDLSKARISITNSKSAIFWFVNEASNIVFENINLKNARGKAVWTENNNNNIKFINCTFENTGENVATISGTSKNIVFDGCSFKHINGGILLNSGETSTLTRGNSIVKNCLFEDFSRITTTYNAAVTLGGVGNTVSHNTIRNAPQMAIQIYGGTDHVIEYNDIYNVLSEGDDMSVIYTGRTWISRGIKIRYNYIHDIASFVEDRVGIYGVYLDDLYSGMEITGNVFADFGGYPVFINGGRDNTVKSNIFANTLGSLYMTSIGVDEDKDMSGFYNGINKVKEYESKDLWYQKYPELVTVMDNEPRKPVNNVFAENLIINSERGNYLDIWAEKLLINENNIVKTYEEAGFDGSEGKEYQLLPESDVFNFFRNFRQIPINQMGPR